MLINRIFLIKLHMIVAAFIFPAALMFLLTGALYTWGIKGYYDTEKYSVSLQQPMQNDKAWLTQLAIHELNMRELSLPSGKAKLRLSVILFILSGLVRSWILLWRPLATLLSHN